MPVKLEPKASYNLPPSYSKCGTLRGNIDDKHTHGGIESQTTSQNIFWAVLPSWAFIVLAYFLPLESAA